MLRGLTNDIRYAARTLRHSPGFAAAAIATIALGVGVDSGIFTVLNGVLFRNLPAPEAGQLVSIYESVAGAPNRQTGLGLFSTSEYRAYRERTRTLSGLIGYSDPTRTTLGGESPQQIVGEIVSCNYFEVLRQPPALGRGLRPEDCRAGADPVVVLSHELWTARFSADSGVLGRSVELNRRLFTVVGVASEDTFGGFVYRTAYFAPIPTQRLLLPNETSYEDDGYGWLFAIGRRKPGVGLEQVRAELGLIASQIDARHPGRKTALRIDRATPLSIPPLRTVALAGATVIMIAFGLVLLIACSNVANLVLARGAARSREIGVRLSLGASRARVVRQLLTESLAISVVGGALGTVVGLWSFRALVAFAIPAVFSGVGIPPIVLDPSPDVRVWSFTLALTLGTAVLFGLAPALRASKQDLHGVIKQGPSGAGSGREGRLPGVLVAVQVALCMVLMIGAALLLRGLWATQTVRPGFAYRDVAYASYDLPSAGYGPERAAELQRRLLRRAASLPGIESAAYASRTPLNHTELGSIAVRLPGQPEYASEQAQWNVVSPGFFSVVGIPIVRGRTFTDAELTGDERVAIVTEATARNYWPGQDPIGRTLLVKRGPQREVALQVVGVARDAEVTLVGKIDPYYVYLPAAPAGLGYLSLLVKSRTGFAATAAEIRAAMRDLDPGVVVTVSPLESNVEFWRNLAGLMAALAGALGVLALALACIGIYGVVSYFVNRRYREIGIRMALGASSGKVLNFVLGRTVRPVGIGAALGIAAAVASSGALSGLLFGVSRVDVIGFTAGASLVLCVATAAALLPGRRVSRSDPMTTLRDE